MKRFSSQAGRRAEEIAARFLTGRGYRILKRNFTCRPGEIDIIASKDGEIIFIEVRYRSRTSFMYPEESITAAKAERIKRAADVYLRMRGLNEPFMRFDLICVTKGGWFEPVKTRHIKDAF